MVPAHDSADVRPATTTRPPDLSASAAGPRSDLDLTRQQLAAIERWHDSRRWAQQAAQGSTASREARMDLARRLDVVRAEHRALVERTEAQLRSSVELLRRAARRRAIVVHRNAWFADKVAGDLGLRQIEVVARLTNGAEAVGAVVAEQPDLLLVEESLPMMSGEDVVREVRTFAPRTLIGAQVASGDRIPVMLEAGAHTACTRRVPPADVAAALAGLLPATLDSA